jgi:phosphoenolpyruvate synthase/pyruvate phosphate dikinase
MILLVRFSNYAPSHGGIGHHLAPPERIFAKGASIIMAREWDIADLQDRKNIDPLIVDIEDNAMDDLSLVGGKAAGLMRLCRIPDIDVPPALVVTSKAFDLFLQMNPKLVAMIARLDSIEDSDLLVEQAADILAVANTTSIWETTLGVAAGVITDIGGAGCHTATVMREQGKPALVGAANGTSILAGYDNQMITLDATQKIVLLGKVPPEWLRAPNSFCQWIRR